MVLLSDLSDIIPTILTLGAYMFESKMKIIFYALVSIFIIIGGYLVLIKIADSKRHTISADVINEDLKKIVGILKHSKMDQTALDDLTTDIKKHNINIFIITDKKGIRINKWDIVLTLEEYPLCVKLVETFKYKSSENIPFWTNLQINDECTDLDKITYTALNTK